MNKGHLSHIESIRAFAALSVALFHFTNHYDDNFLISNENVRETFRFGAQGVEMFYLISGFIIPYSLFRSKYQIKHYFHYLGKRLSRLLPPYYVTIGLITLVGFILATYLWYYPYDMQWRNLVANALFAVDFIEVVEPLKNAFPDNGWINPIFETLKVEFQFYLLIGLLFPFINRKRIFFVLLCVVLLFLGIQTMQMNTVLVNSPYFLLGICAFYIFNEGWSWLIGLCLAFCFGTLGYFYVLQDLIISVIAFGFVVFLPSSFRFLSFTGKISYSYYLIHGLIGGNFLYFTRDHLWSQDYPYLMIIFALLLSWIGAFLMYFCIEKPSLLISKRIKYNKE